LLLETRRYFIRSNLFYMKLDGVESLLGILLPFLPKKTSLLLLYSTSKSLVPFPVRPNHFFAGLFIHSSVCLLRICFLLLHSASLFESRRLCLCSNMKINIYESQPEAKKLSWTAKILYLLKVGLRKLSHLL